MYDRAIRDLTEFGTPKREIVESLGMDDSASFNLACDGGSLRSTLAEYLMRNEVTIRKMARAKLTREVQSISDSEDVFSSVVRRVDLMVVKGTLRPRSLGELWKCIEAITVNLAVDRVRMISRLRQFTAEDGDFAQHVIKRLEGFSSDDQAAILLYRMMMSLPVAEDRQLLDLRIRGATIKAAAGLLGMKFDAASMRWFRLKMKLSKQFEEGQLDDTGPGKRIS
jgi:hypothetical protein